MTVRGRRPGSPATREQILSAAKRQFAELGYPHATMRSIAQEAGVNARLVTHYFGSKQELFLAALDFPIDPGDIIEAAADDVRTTGVGLGVAFVRHLLDALAEPGVAGAVSGMMRAAATEPEANELVRRFISDHFLAPAIRGFGARGLGGDRADGEDAGPDGPRGVDDPLRVALVGSQIVGLVLLRLIVGIEPLVGATSEQLAWAIGPTIERYLVGDIQPRSISPDREQD